MRLFNPTVISQLNFGTTSTSRGEGSHYVLKRYLKIANLDLLQVLTRLNLMLVSQYTELNASMESEKLVVEHRHKLHALGDLVKKVSHFALDKLLEQYKKIGKDQEDCTGTFRSTYGLPCSHDIMAKIHQGLRIALADVHPQWHLERNPLFNEAVAMAQPLSPRSRTLQLVDEKIRSSSAETAPTLLARLQETCEEPIPSLSSPAAVMRKRGCPAGSKKRSNQRDKSYFEHATGRRCGNCGEAGHNSRTCSKD